MEDKEVYMEVSKLPYKEILGDHPELANELANLSPIILEGGSIVSFGKEGMYILGEGIKK